MGPQWGRTPNRNDVVGWGLSNLLAPVTDAAQGVGQFLQHPSLSSFGGMLASPFEGIGQMTGGNVGINAVPGYNSPGSALPAPVPALGAHMSQAHAGHGNPRAIVSYMGLGTAQWTATSPLTQSMNPEPQAPFIGNRMIVVSKPAGASATGIQINITSPLTVSGVPQTPAPNVPAPIEMFAQDATYSALQIQIAAAGTAIAISFTASALPTGTDLVNLSAGLYGYWLR